MEKIKDIIQYLMDPHLVADFQHACGVVSKEGYGQNGDVHSHRTKNDNNNLAQRNGYAYNLRNRRVPRSSELQSGDKNEEENDDVSSSESEEGTTEIDEDEEGEEVKNKLHSHERELTHYTVNSKLLFYLFSCGTGVGNELFYAAFFPAWFWNVDGFVIRRLILIWGIIMYIGQATKDVFRIPRPASPPVIRMDRRYHLEYGMPSTHAMVGIAFPITLLILTVERYTYPFFLGLVLAVLWCGTVCLSRVYMGMHTLLDLLAGVVFALIIVGVMWPLLDIIDEFQVYHPYGPLIMGITLLLMCVFYPTLDKWSTARGDTTLILGVLAGVALGSWLNIQQGNYHNEAGAPPYFVKTPDHIWFAKMSCRMVLGLVILFSTRVIMKALTYYLLCHILGYDKKDHMLNKQKLIVELPYKFITYYVIAFNVVYTAPAIFRYLDIEKETYFTEI